MSDSSDPIRFYNELVGFEPGWYFWDETWAFSYGPYPDVIIARAALVHYCAVVLDGDPIERERRRLEHIVIDLQAENKRLDNRNQNLKQDLLDRGEVNVRLNKRLEKLRTIIARIPDGNVFINGTLHVQVVDLIALHKAAKSDD